MKKLIFLIVILALAAANAFAARIYPAEGRVVDEQGPVSYTHLDVYKRQLS